MKILMIGAHQDDNDFRYGGLAYKYVRMAYNVRFLSLCDGCGGHTPHYGTRGHHRAPTEEFKQKLFRF